jgi:2-polyprenyl-3-methyl-5-hydroxy-6-metoxy-1,4-benzoquinol methylase
VSEIELHRKMLGDKVRNDALHAALRRVIKPGMTVADIGAGTGFLAFLARQLGASHCHLYEYSDTLGLAEELARRNGISGLTFVQAHSSEVTRPPKVDVVISETLGNYALEEGLLETLVDARRFLKPGGTLLPRALRQYVAPVVTPRLQGELDIWPSVGHGLDLTAAREVGLNNMYVKTVRVADLPGLDSAQQWDAIDFAGKGKLSSQRTGGARWQGRALKGATVHGFALWWEVDVVDGITLSTAPDAPPTHWEQIYLPLLEPVTPGPRDALELSLSSDTREGVRLVWETRVRGAGGKPLSSQRQDLLRGRL